MNSNVVLKVDNVLKHYGILGMKWGRRKDRSSTSSGSKSEDYKKTRELQKKKLSEMTNQDLQILTQRMQLERQYSTLSPNKKGSNVVAEILKKAAKESAETFIKKYANKQIDKVISKLS